MNNSDEQDEFRVVKEKTVLRIVNESPNEIELDTSRQEMTPEGPLTILTIRMKRKEGK